MSKIGNWFNKLSNRLGNALEETPHPSSSTQEVKEHVTHRKQRGTSVSPKKRRKAAPTTKTSRVEKVKIESKDGLLQSIIKTLSDVVEYKDSTNGKRLTIWLDCNQAKYANYDTEAYKHHLLSSLINECGYGFDEVCFSLGKPAEDLRATVIGNSQHEYLQIQERNIVATETKCSTAIISIHGNAGSLLQDQYILSFEDMKAKNITAYNIGAGQFPQIPSGYRENHIAIDDNPNSPMIERNKYISRMHAHIGFSEKFGFYLQVEKDGTRLLGKRTRIFRGEEQIECENPQAKVPLQSGDLIELGKHVVLKFMEINN